MKMKSLLFPIFFVAGFMSLLFTVGHVSAYNSPAFPSCLNPEGQVISFYDSGIHGIVGDSSEHVGSDTVYFINDHMVLQCFCDENGRGIQTDWWKVVDLSDEEVEFFKNEGWIYVESGSDWGLGEGAFLAKNSEYICPECVSPTPTISPTEVPTPTPTVTFSTTPTSTPTPQNSSQSSSSSQSSGQTQSASEVLSAKAPTPVTTLAYTGSASKMSLELVLGVVTAGLSFVIKRIKK